MPAKVAYSQTALALLRSPFGIIVAIGLVLRLGFALLPQHMHLALLEDDAWMVTNIARHWALGHGITADGIHPTNGFHPLYPLTLGAIPYLLQPNNLDVGFQANVIICALLNTLALFPLYGLLRLVARQKVALAGLAIIAINPFFIRVSVNGMETSLALLLLLTLWWYALAHPTTTITRAAWLGGLAGLAILARLDNMLAAGIVGVVLVWGELRNRQLPRMSLTYGLVTGVILLPYFARNLIVFGHLTPSSGRALSYMHSYRESFAFSSGLQLAAYQPAIDLTNAPTWGLILAMGILVLLAVFVWREHGQRLTPLLLYTLVLTFYYAYLQMQGRPRYYVAVGVVVVLLLCAASDKLITLAERSPHPRRQRGAMWLLPAVALVAIVLNTSQFISYVTTLQHARYLAQPAMYHAARWIANNLPADARLAAQNSGVFQYYSERVVLNIDGKLNHEIIPVLEARQLDRYLQAKGVQYIVDLDGVGDYITFYSSSMSEAPTHHEIATLGKLRIYAGLIAAKLGMGEPPTLDERVPTRIIQPFTERAEVVQQFPLPNDPSQAVVIYHMLQDQ